MSNFIHKAAKIVDSSRILYTPSPFAKNSLIYLQEIGSLTAKAPHTSQRTNLDSFLFVMVTAGSGTLTYDGVNYTLTAGSCAFIDCRKPYAHATSADNLWSLSWLHFAGNSMDAIYDKYIARGGKAVFEVENLDSFLQLHGRLYELAGSTDYIRDMKINAGLNELLVLLMQESWHPEESHSHKQKRDMLPVKCYLDEHFTEKIALEALAARFYMNKFYMTRLFKEQYGLSINTYLQQVRVTRAKQLLRFSDASLESIGFSCGIGEQNYFSRLFRKIEGVSPSEYRISWRGK